MITVEIFLADLRRVPYTGIPYVGWLEMQIVHRLKEAWIPVISNILGQFCGIESGCLSRKHGGGGMIFTWEAPDEGD